MTTKFVLLKPRFEHKQGSFCFPFMGHTYGLVHDDEAATGERHLAMTLNEDGEGPFFTVPITDVEAAVKAVSAS